MRMITYILVVIMVILAAVLPVAEVRQENAYICKNTGVRHGYTQWIGGLRSDAWSRSSPLHDRLVELGIRSDHQWLQYIGTTYTLFGSVRLRSHERAGDLLAVDEAEIKAALDAMQDDEVRKLYDTKDAEGLGMWQELLEGLSVAESDKPVIKNTDIFMLGLLIGEDFEMTGEYALMAYDLIHIDLYEILEQRDFERIDRAYTIISPPQFIAVVRTDLRRYSVHIRDDIVHLWQIGLTADDQQAPQELRLSAEQSAALHAAILARSPPVRVMLQAD